MKSITIYLLVIFFSSIKLCGNNIFKSDSCSVKPIGFGLKYREAHQLASIKGLPVTTNPFFIELSIRKQANGSKYWHQSLGFPETGLSLSIASHGNKKVYGESCNIDLFADFNFVKREKLTFGSHVAMGFAAFSKYYDAEHNKKNLLVGSRFTNITTLELFVDYKVKPKLSLRTGFSIIHFSNAHTALPNVGMNYINAFAGILFGDRGRNIAKEKSIKNKLNTKWVRNIRFGRGSHEFGVSVKPTEGPDYPIYALTGYLSKRYTPVYALQLGFFYNYYVSFKDFIVNQEFYKDNIHLKASTFEIFVGNEFFLGNISFMIQSSIKIYNRFMHDYIRMYRNDLSFMTKVKSLNSNKFGLQYYIKEPAQNVKSNLALGIFLKANFGQADFVEMSVCLSF